jgi:hypothetical protein
MEHVSDRELDPKLVYALTSAYYDNTFEASLDSRMREVARAAVNYTEGNRSYEPRCVWCDHKLSDGREGVICNHVDCSCSHRSHMNAQEV